MTQKAENQNKGIRMSTKEPVVTSKEDLETVEIQHWVDMLEALERLERNSDFQKVIIDGYIQSKALDSVSLLARPDVKKRGERTDVMEDLVAISNFQYFLAMVHRLGGSAKQDIEEYNSEGNGA